MAGPFPTCLFPQLQCSSIGLVPKHEPDSHRLIQHLSFSHGGSINDFIDDDKCKVHYASFDKAVDMTMSSEHGVRLAKSDIKSTFRLLPVLPADYELLGFMFDCNIHYDKCFPMGCTISCALFEKFSAFLEFKVKFMTKSSSITHYLDDFLFVGPTPSSCAAFWHGRKTEGPTQAITYLSLEIDSPKQEVRVPAVKIHKMCEQIK